MRKLAFAILLLAACGRKHPAPTTPAPLTITITHDGFVKFEGKAVTLDELGTLLAARRAAAPVEAHPHCGPVPTLPVLLDIEDEVPWQHVEFVLDMATQQHFASFVFHGGRAVTLPGSPHTPGEPEHTALQARVLVLDDGRYVIDERTTHDIRQIGAWIEAAPMAFIDARAGMIRAQPRAPWRSVGPVLDLFQELGMVCIDFYGSTWPSPEERQRPSLPPPPVKPRYRGWPGLVKVAYWPNLRYCDCDLVFSEPRAELRAAIDEHRLGFGFPSLEYDDALGNAASLHAEEMRRLGYFGHFSPTPANHSPSDRLSRFGWPEKHRHAELLAKAETREGALKAILAKPENAAVLANPAFRYAGVAQCGDCWVVLLGAAP
jgi:biopolymer transport protein ExbD